MNASTEAPNAVGQFFKNVITQDQIKTGLTTADDYDYPGDVAALERALKCPRLNSREIRNLIYNLEDWVAVNWRNNPVAERTALLLMRLGHRGNFSLLRGKVSPMMSSNRLESERRYIELTPPRLSPTQEVLFRVVDRAHQAVGKIIKKMPRPNPITHNYCDELADKPVFAALLGWLAHPWNHSVSGGWNVWSVSKKSWQTPSDWLNDLSFCITSKSPLWRETTTFGRTKRFPVQLAEAMVHARLFHSLIERLHFEAVPLLAKMVVYPASIYRVWQPRGTSSRSKETNQTVNILLDHGLDWFVNQYRFDSVEEPSEMERESISLWLGTLSFLLPYWKKHHQ
ncbi:MAG: hypothetical protein A3J59_04890 [Candidatus Buchananbacteria bacterium RIFCSPHIGHO2_02_FULL_56_16]|uniref:Uncharacterized protein n=1 Tax=Candidatus Buchananbacteria bacterium RIFCSPHIGHO2_02_FULL_56_16 TaxID=1797542 RepID=A0A1G1YGY4_9BACT|nr:MAG: hypothetical protein A3J59_04890 [Candidatus Buchananbacteria bacterium RIFCSPHIGHO2_02_FULL_56_16]